MIMILLCTFMEHCFSSSTLNKWIAWSCWPLHHPPNMQQILPWSSIPASYTRHTTLPSSIHIIQRACFIPMTLTLISVHQSHLHSICGHCPCHVDNCQHWEEGIWHCRHTSSGFVTQDPRHGTRTQWTVHHWGEVACIFCIMGKQAGCATRCAGHSGSWPALTHALSWTVTGLPQPDFLFTYKPSLMTLFCFSALTFNRHHILKILHNTVRVTQVCYLKLAKNED